MFVIKWPTYKLVAHLLRARWLTGLFGIFTVRDILGSYEDTPLLHQSSLLLVVFVEIGACLGILPQYERGLTLLRLGCGCCG